MTALAAPPIPAGTPTVTRHQERDASWQSARTPTFVSHAPQTAGPSESLEAFERCLAEIEELPSGWDSYGAEPPPRHVLSYTRQLVGEFVARGLAAPEVFPTRSGGIQLEWHGTGGHLEWEIDPGLVTGVFLYDDERSGERWEGDLPDDLGLLASAISRVFAG